MSATYGIELIQANDDPRGDELSQAIAAELEDVGLHRSVNVIVAPGPLTIEGPVVCVCLITTNSAGWDPTGAIGDAISRGIVVVPVVTNLADFHDVVPSILAGTNGFEWNQPTDAARLSRFLLEELGIEERSRRVFISHKREDGLGAAEQLHDRLIHAGFVPFIDRFAIRSGKDVQKAIANALEDHAFLLLVETPLAYTSPWVFDELDYALSHTMGTLIISWPGEHDIPGSKRLPRLKLAPENLTQDAHGYDVLNEETLDGVVAAVEASHAHGLVRRRRMLVTSIEDAARAAGHSPIPLPGWRIAVHTSTGTTLVGTTPRLPSSSDLQLLDQARAEMDVKSAALLVHSARELPSDHRSHLSWVAGDRDLELTPENAIGGRW
jgi:hypothetical protein